MVNQAIHSNEYWQSLVFPDSYISKRSAGDLGPSGNDAAAVSRRNLAFSKFPTGITETIRPNTGNVLICRQVHSLCIIVALQGRQPFSVSGIWDEGGQLRLESTSIPIPYEHWQWQEQRAEFLAWIGSQEADGIVTDDNSWWLGVTVADCLPIVLRALCADGRVIRAVLHSGWGGTGILAAALTAISQSGAQTLCVQMGPCIGAIDYPVPVERGVLFKNRFGRSTVVQCPDGQPGLDLMAANRALFDGLAPCLKNLANSNGGSLPWADLITKAEHHEVPGSTCKIDWMQSYRRYGPANYGRMLCMIGIPDHE